MSACIQVCKPVCLQSGIALRWHIATIPTDKWEHMFIIGCGSKGNMQQRHSQFGQMRDSKLGWGSKRQPRMNPYQFCWSTRSIQWNNIEKRCLTPKGGGMSLYNLSIYICKHCQEDDWREPWKYVGLCWYNGIPQKHASHGKRDRIILDSTCFMCKQVRLGGRSICWQMQAWNCNSNTEMEGVDACGCLNILNHPN